MEERVDDVIVIFRFLRSVIGMVGIFFELNVIFERLCVYGVYFRFLFFVD